VQPSSLPSNAPPPPGANSPPSAPKASASVNLGYAFSEDVHVDARQVTWPPATPKDFIAVLQGKSDAAFPSGNGLWTYGLVTCLGIGVVGTAASAINEPRHMLHMESTAAVMDAQWETFEKR
jgi:hypothetical protein